MSGDQEPWSFLGGLTAELQVCIIDIIVSLLIEIQWDSNYMLKLERPCKDVGDIKLLFFSEQCRYTVTLLF